VNYIKRKPNIAITIKRPDYSSSSCPEYIIVKFMPKPVLEDDKAKAGEKWAGAKNYEAMSDALLSYSYSESVYDVESPFSLSFTPEVDKNGLTWIDKIAIMDLVYIEEFGVIRYCGIVHRVRYSAKMGQEGATRTIVVSGNGFGDLLKLFQLNVDPRFWLGKTAPALNQATKAECATDEKKTMKATMDYYYDSFMKIVSLKDAGEGGSSTQSAIKALLDRMIDKSKIADTFETLLPIVASLYQPGVNNIWDMWRKIVPSPLCELFGRWDFDKQKYCIIARPAPFEAEDWAALDSFKIHPIALTDYDVGFDDSEVSTYFYATAPNLSITDNMSLVVDKYKENGAIDEEKWLKYGYRPLGTTIRFLKRDPDKPNSIPKALNDVAAMTKNWYCKNDEFLSGSINLISIDDDSVMKYPVVGARAQFLGGEFYIEQIDRKWTYGDSPKTTLKVTRGYMYGSSGALLGPIKNLGKRLKEFEATTYRENGQGS